MKQEKFNNLLSTLGKCERCTNFKEEEYITINRNAYNKFAKQHIERHNNLSKYDLTDAIGKNY